MTVPTLNDVLQHDLRHFAGKTAVTIDDAAMTYGELARRVDEARRLLGAHVRPGDRVAIWLPNSFAWIASFLALASLGAVSVPVSTRLTPQELSVIVKDAGVRLILASPHYRGRNYVEQAESVADGIVPIVVAAPGDASPSDWKVRQVAPNAPAAEPLETPGVFCIQYTSGTTATPKGVMLTEALYLQTAAYVVRCQMLKPSTSFMSAAPFFHCSGSMHAITCCLLAGCTLHTMSAWDAELFLRLCQQHRGDTGHGIFFTDILAMGPDKARGPLSTLKTANDIGSLDSMRRLQSEFGIAGLSNLYGMTETGGNFTMWFPDDPLEPRLLKNGRPQPMNAVRIADPATGETLGAGKEGEIQMKGQTLTPGYYKRPEANRTAFTADGWFRSGDLGTLSPDGELHFIARLRDIVRVGGENVAPAEVEQAIQDMTGLKKISVVSVEDQRLGEVAALVIAEPADVDWPETLQALRTKLADFKIPRHVYAADAMPMTPTNKVQRATLQQWIKQEKLKRLN